MKGFMIYETPLWGDEENVVYVQEVKDASYTLKKVGSDDITCYLEGIANGSVAKATCNKEDTYDFEMGALIALMKKCGREKVAEACCEAFPHETSGSIYRGNKQYRERIKELRKENDRLEEKVDDLYTFNKKLINEIDQKNHEIISLKALKLTNESLKKDNESFRKSCEKLKEENERLINTRDLLINKNKELNKSIYAKRVLNEKLLKDYNSAQSVYEIMVEKSADLMDKVKKLEEENEKLKLDCEMLQHGYNEWLHRPSTKRGEMWEKIFELHKENDVIIKVKKEDVNTFLHEIENKIPEITWSSTVKIFETKYTIGNIYEELKTHDTIYFRLSKINTLSYSSDPHTYHYRELKHVDYLPPMRWDLFKKGRLVVKVDSDNYEDFYNKCEIELGRKPYYIFNKGPFTVYYKKGTFHTRPYDEKIPYKYKVVNWEDVR